MQGFNMGRYRPYDSDPRKESFNAQAGKHPLGNRARKLDQGILIVRFELPFNIWCDGCGNHIGQGVRYNAEKKKVGQYYSTPIWSFRCKCHLCSSWFEIRTDPQNTRYVVEAGAKQQNQEWDADANGSFSIELDKGEGTSSKETADAFSVLEKDRNDKIQAKKTTDRILELEQHNERWSDPYTLNAKLRKQLRKDKRVALRQEEADSLVKGRIGWREDAQLAAEDEESKDAARADWVAEKARHKQELATKGLNKETLSIEMPTPLRTGSSSAAKKRSGASQPASKSSLFGTKANPAARSLAAALSAKTRQKNDPFLEQVRSVIKK